MLAVQPESVDGGGWKLAAFALQRREGVSSCQGKSASSRAYEMNTSAGALGANTLRPERWPIDPGAHDRPV